MNEKLALEFRRAMQYFIETLTDENKILEIPSVYPKYKVGVPYKTKAIFSYELNSVGDPQLYQVLQDHTSAEEWTPDTATSLYKAIGIAENGIPEWVQPLGASDAYMIGEEVMYKGAHYRSTIDNNVWAPDTYPQGWEIIAESEVSDNA